MNSQKGFAIIPIIIIVVVLIAGGAGGYLYFKNKNINKPVACTQEAKQCPDGSYVGRVGPKCEFAECASVTVTKLINTTTTILFDGLNTPYFKDNNYVYFKKYEGTTQKIKGVAPVDFQILGVCGSAMRNYRYYTKDKDKVYCDNHMIEDADVVTFQYIGIHYGWPFENIGVAKDKNYVYHEDKKVLSDINGVYISPILCAKDTIDMSCGFSREHIKDTPDITSIGEKGGIVISPDGKMKLEFLGGSLDSEFKFRINTSNNDFQQIGPLYYIEIIDINNFKLHGYELLKFKKPVYITINYDPYLLPQGAIEEKSMIGVLEILEGLFSLGNSSVDIEKNIITATTTEIRSSSAFGVVPIFNP